MTKNINSIIPTKERKEISQYFHIQTEELQNIRNEIIGTIPTNTLWAIVIETKEKGIEKFNEIVRKHDFKEHSHAASKIKRIIKAIICFYQKEEKRTKSKDETIEILNKKERKRTKKKLENAEEKNKREERERIEKEKAVLALRIKEYFGTKDKHLLPTFRGYFQKREKEGGNFYDNISYATEKICKIYRGEYNEIIVTLFQDRARGNNYLKEQEETIIQN